MRPDVVPHFLFGPVSERIDFDETAMLQVCLDLADGGASGGLVATQASDPGVKSGQDPAQRQDFTCLAAQEP